MDRSLLVIGRHGTAPKNPHGHSLDSIKPDSIGRMYLAARNLSPVIKELKIRPCDTFLRWSGKVRTLYTGKTKAAGALDLARTVGSGWLRMLKV